MTPTVEFPEAEMAEEEYISVVPMSEATDREVVLTTETTVTTWESATAEQPRPDWTVDFPQPEVAEVDFIQTPAVEEVPKPVEEDVTTTIVREVFALSVTFDCSSYFVLLMIIFSELDRRIKVKKFSCCNFAFLVLDDASEPKSTTAASGTDRSS